MKSRTRLLATCPAMLGASAHYAVTRRHSHHANGNAAGGCLCQTDVPGHVMHLLALRNDLEYLDGQELRQMRQRCKEKRQKNESIAPQNGDLQPRSPLSAAARLIVV